MLRQIIAQKSFRFGTEANIPSTRAGAEINHTPTSSHSGADEVNGLSNVRDAGLNGSTDIGIL